MRRDAKMKVEREREKSLGSNGRGLKEKMEIKKWDEADQKEALEEGKGREGPIWFG